MTTTHLLGGLAVPVLIAATVATLALRRGGKRKVTDTPPGRVVIACNLADSRRASRR